MDDTNHISLWDKSSAEPRCEAVPEGGERCDLAIVGGGFTGLSCALHGAEAGLDCHVLEAQHVGYGGSGRNVGLVNPGLWLPPQDVNARLGDERGSALVRRLGDMPDYVFELIERHQIRCEATRNGTIHAAHSPKGLDDLRRRAEGWHRLGAPVEMLGADELAEKSGTRRYHGGLLDRRAGTINPMGYARGLARAARAAGARVSEGVSVERLERQDDGWCVHTNAGPVHAKFVVIATNAYTGDLWPGLRQSFTAIHFFQMATEPLGDRAAHILKQGQGLWDTAPVMFGLRRDAFGRLIVGSMGAVIGGKRGLTGRWAARMLRRLFPDLGPVQFEEAWHGRIAMTPDHLFRIHRLADGLYTPIGYNGRGITTGTMFGQALAGLLTGAGEETLPVPVTDLAPAPARRLKHGLYQTAFALHQAWKSL